MTRPPLEKLITEFSDKDGHLFSVLKYCIELERAVKAATKIMAHKKEVYETAGIFNTTAHEWLEKWGDKFDE